MYTSIENAKTTLQNHKAFALIKWSGLDVDAIAAYMFNNDVSVETILIEKSVL